MLRRWALAVQATTAPSRHFSHLSTSVLWVRQKPQVATKQQQQTAARLALQARIAAKALMLRTQRSVMLQTTLAQLEQRDKLAPLEHTLRLEALRQVELLARRARLVATASVTAPKRFAKLATFRQPVHRAHVP